MRGINSTKKHFHFIGIAMLVLAYQNCGGPISSEQIAQLESRQVAVDAAVKSLLLAEAGTGKTYYVDTARGLDTNPGTLTSPWKNLAKAAAIAVAGDTVYIRGGTYRERLTPKNSGNSTAGYITFAAYNNEAVTLDGTGLPTAWNGMVDVTNRSYIQIMGLKTINYEHFGICAQSANNIKILGNSTFNTGRSGIYVRGSTKVTIDGNEISRANTVLNQESLSITDGTNDFVVSNNIVHGGKMEGIDAKGGAYNGKIINNVVYDTARIGIYVDGYASGVHDILIEGNIVRDPNPTPVSAGQDAIRIGAEAGGFVNNVTIRNNVVYGAKTAGILLASYHQAGKAAPRYNNISIVHNTVYGNGKLDGGGILIQESVASGIVIANNIVSDNNAFSIKVESSVASKVSVIRNLIDKLPDQRLKEDEVLGSGYVSGDPQFVDVATRNFRLKPSSPAIDSGSSTFGPEKDFDGTLRPQGNGDDIGAFEYKFAGDVPAPTPTPAPTPSTTPTPAPFGADTQAPKVSITSPTNGSTVPANTWLKMTASATDNVGVTKVAYYVNGVLKCTRTVSPYACGFTLPSGAGRIYTIRARAYDAAGKVGYSAAVSVTSR